MEIKYDSLTYRDPLKAERKVRSIPTLTKLELKLYNSIAQDLKHTGRKYLKRTWLKSKTKHRATLLEGIGRYNPMSNDLQISFETKTIPLEKAHDLLK